MDSFWVVTLFHWQPSSQDAQSVESEAMATYGALGIEEFSLDEPEVDALLGERSYSGGDLPQSVLDEVEERVLSKPTNYRFFFDSSAQAEEFKSYVSKVQLCESQVEECPGQDWNAEWKKHYSPIKVNEHLEIVPSWMLDYQSQAKKKIFIYPGMGFGTGSHETTFLCLKLFTENLPASEAKTVLDFGSGSGILGLSSFLFSQDVKVDFYDIDPEANKNCYQNAELNQLTGKPFRLLLPEVREKLLPQYDVVFANILESILIQEEKSLINHTSPGGSLILSGLLKPQAEGIIKLYSEAGLTLVKRLDKGDWSALLFQKAR